MPYRASEPLSLEARSLLERSGTWVAAAMEAWANDQTDKVTALAPLAVELALKALLWHVNPTLLVPLEKQQERSLIALATAPRITDQGLRTIGLTEAISRSIAVVGSEPQVIKGRRDRLVACRNGSVHLGGVTAEASRHVLTDAILILAWALDALNVPQHSFFGANFKDCSELLRKGRSEIEQGVMAKLSRHRRNYEARVADLPQSAAHNLIAALEASAMVDHYPVDEAAPDLLAARQQCPACKHHGALYGLFTVEPDVDAEYEDGEISYYSGWAVELTPEMFICDVCRLNLWGPPELQLAGLPFDTFVPDEADLGDFDVNEYVGNPYADDY